MLMSFLEQARGRPTWSLPGTRLVTPGLDRHFRLWVNLLAFYHFLQLVSRNSGKGSLTSGLAWGPRMP